MIGEDGVRGNNKLTDEERKRTTVNGRDYKNGES